MDNNVEKENTIRVSINMIMVSKLYRSIKDVHELSNKLMISKVHDQINIHFGNRPVLITDEDIVTLPNRTYPEFFAAGWFIRKDDEKDTGSELVVVAHGNSMKTAQYNMMREIKSLDWNKSARKL
jgi:hypothetical protein